MKFAIYIPTYQRKDGKTKELLTKALLSIKNQIHQDYKVFLIGDKYENQEEFFEIANTIIDPAKIYFENLQFANEREKYFDEKKIWCSGGTYASNFAISKAIQEKFEWICRIDHDDVWSETHLLNFSNFLEKENQNCILIASRCLVDGQIYPKKSAPGIFFPEESDIGHSTVCINFSKLSLRYRDVFEETGIVAPSDADFWERLSEYSKNNGLICQLLEEVTVIYEKIL